MSIKIFITAIFVSITGIVTAQSEVPPSSQLVFAVSSSIYKEQTMNELRDDYSRSRAKFDTFLKRHQLASKDLGHHYLLILDPTITLDCDLSEYEKLIDMLKGGHDIPLGKLPQQVKNAVYNCLANHEGGGVPRYPSDENSVCFSVDHTIKFEGNGKQVAFRVGRTPLNVTELSKLR